MHAARPGSPARAQPADMSELLLELLSEEIPARMQARAIEDLTSLLREKLSAAEIPAESLRSFVTPRRLAVIAQGIRRPSRIASRSGGDLALALRSRRLPAFFAPLGWPPLPNARFAIPIEANSILRC